MHPNHWAKRLRIARGFAAYLQTIDPTSEIPPPDVFPVRRQRATPYLFSQQDICRLLSQARELRNPLRAASYEALFGLLAISGMRIGEAIARDSAGRRAVADLLATAFTQGQSEPAPPGVPATRAVTPRCLSRQARWPSRLTHRTARRRRKR